MVDLSSPNRTQQAVVLAGGKVARKYRRKLWKKECRNLKAILPKVANKRVSDVSMHGYFLQWEMMWDGYYVWDKYFFCGKNRTYPRNFSLFFVYSGD